MAISLRPSLKTAFLLSLCLLIWTLIGMGQVPLLSPHLPLIISWMNLNLVQSIIQKGRTPYKSRKEEIQSLTRMFLLFIYFFICVCVYMYIYMHMEVRGGHQVFLCHYPLTSPMPASMDSCLFCQLLALEWHTHATTPSFIWVCEIKR